MDYISTLLVKNGLVVAFLVTGIITYSADGLSKKLTNNKIPGSAIAIFLGLVLAYIGGIVTGGNKGIADIKQLSGFELMGGSMFRDFAIVSTALGVSFAVVRKTGIAGIISLLIGVVFTFACGAVIAYAMGYTDAKSITTIGAGACTFIVGPVTGAAVGASSDVIANSIAAGLVKSILVTIGTPLIARYIGLNNPSTAMIFGGLMGTTSGVAAGLAATDPKLVPYGAMTATFYTGLGCLLCPSVLYLLVTAFFWLETQYAMIDLQKIVAIDVHTHAEVSCCQPHDDYRPEFDLAFAKYFKSDKRPTIQETADYYRERSMAFVMFTVDSEFETGKRRIPNEEVAEGAAKNSDVMIAFASIDPHKGRMGAREARRLIEELV